MYLNTNCTAVENSWKILCY